MKILYYILVPIIAFLVLFVLSILFNFIRYYIKGYRLQKSKSNYRKPGFLKRLLIQFPERLVLDKYNRDPAEFNEYGLHLFCGEQGSGKTTAVVHLLHMMKDKYPDLKIRTNFNYNEQDEPIEDWTQLVKNENGIYGQIEVIDEIQTWFNSMQSKDFPPEMLTEISQQRKQRKMLVGTAQVFGRVAKPIREQTSFVYLPFTFLGCLTIVRVSKPHFYDEKDFKFKKYLRTYFFIHTDQIRNSFDTYKKIEGLVKSGFNVRKELYCNNDITVNL